MDVWLSYSSLSRDPVPTPIAETSLTAFSESTTEISVDKTQLARDKSRDLLPAATQAMPEFLLRQRWYPAKEAGRPQVAIDAWLPFAVGGLEAAVAVWRGTPPGQAAIHIFAPVVLVPAGEADPAETGTRLPTNESEGKSGGDQAIVEAFSQDAFVHAWIDLLLGSGGLAAQPNLRAETTRLSGEAGIKPDAN